MRRRTLFYCGSLSLLAVLLSGGGLFGGKTTSALTPTVANASTRSVSTSPPIDQLVFAVLTNMHQHSWNAGAMTRGTVTGGLFINWKMDDPSVTNVVRPGPDGNPQHNHDPQVDLSYLTSLADYHQVHPNDQSFASDTARMVPIVVADFKNYTVPKGWLYFDLLKDGLLLHNSALVNEAQSLATDFFTKWYDPRLGFVYNRNHSRLITRSITR